MSHQFIFLLDVTLTQYIAESVVFDDEHLPRRLLHREAAVDHLSRAWEPSLGGEQAHNVLIHGPPDVGKTALTRHSLQKLTGHADVQTAHVRCLGKTSADVVHSVLHDLPDGDPSMNVPREDLCIKLQERVDGPAIVVLDEADASRHERTGPAGRCREFVRRRHLPQSREWLSRLDGRLRRRLSFAEFGLERYGVDELDYSRLEGAEMYLIELVTLFVLESDRAYRSNP
ncbi:AAA family ATPase [Haloarcula sp. JP-L23]|uniref:AAA family ATPase n=1 Tax=Haloarcula sp. JP-L23 TaxID=2716717 RepID=UPI001D044742